MGVILTLGDAWGSEILIDDYEDGLSSKWEEKSFQGKTEYTIAKEDNVRCIQAKSRSAASALYYRINYETKEYPILTWRWKVDRVLTKGDALTKEGDDYAARVYVVFPSIFFWKTRAITYIWANKLPRGSVIANPYSENSVMIAVESGPERTGKWITERRNVYEDYQRVFRADPPKAGAIAIMTDTDNTGEETTAWYGPIRLQKNAIE
jgi:hypothetical protein